MQKIAAIIIAVAAALALTFIVVKANQPSYPTAAELEAERLTIERMQAVAPAQTLASAVLALLPAAAGIVALVLASAWGSLALVRFRRRELVRPDGAGLLPVVYESLPTVAPAALAGFHRAALAAAEQSARVPHNYSPHISYSPHSAPRLDYRADSSRATVYPADEPAALAAASLALPGSIDLAEIGHVPTAQSILLGLAPGGDLVTVAARDLCHVALCGATGQGKSNLMRLIVPQLQAMGARVVLADPHYAPVDPDSGDDWRPIAERLHLAPAVSGQEISALLAWLGGELERRKALRAAGTLDTALFFAFDELPAIVELVKGADEMIGHILREGRKFRMYTVGASQEFLVKTIGGSSALRDCYRTAAYVGGDLKSASALLDMPQKEIAAHESQLGQGVIYLRSKATAPAQLVRAPYASNRAIVGLLGDGTADMVDLGRSTRGSDLVYERTAGQPIDLPHGIPPISHASATAAQVSSAPQSAEAARVASLFAQGLDIAQIVQELRGIRGNEGKRYQNAATEVQALLREALARDVR